MEELARLIDWIEELSPQIWAIYVRQQYVEGFVNIAWVIFLAIVMYPLYRVIVWSKNRATDHIYEDDDVLYMLICIFAACALVTCIIAIPITLTAVMYSFLTPEYLAIKDLLSVVK